jgi:citrate lyase subunit beta/citryl-CoA lyase
MTGAVGSTVLPRSFLYVPATRPDLFAKGAAGATDALVLDLEDAVPVPRKEEARGAVRSWLDGGAGPAAAQTWVRIDADALQADLLAAVHPALRGVFVAKCSSASLAEVGRLLDERERVTGMTVGAVQVVGLVESASALLELAAMTSSPRLTTLGVGEADLLADLRMTRSPGSAAALDALRSQIVVHCAAAGRHAPVAPTSTDFRDLEAFAGSSRHLFDLGFRSRTAIHPGQVPVIHEVFTPSTADVSAAADVVARFEAASSGVTTDAAGRLIDAAVVRGALETIARASGHDAAT